MYLRRVEYDALQSADLIKIIKAQDEKIYLLEFQLKQLIREIHGSKSERFTEPIPDQLHLFGEANQDKEQIPEIVVPSHNRKKTKRVPKRTKLPDHLDRVEIVVDIQGDKQGLRLVKTLITEKLEIEPPKLFVNQYVRYQYVDEQGKFHLPELPSDPFPKSIAGPSLASHIIVNKYVDHLPLYRQSKIFARHQIELSRSTQCDLVRKTAELLHPLYEALDKQIMSSDYLMADESSIPVLNKDQEQGTKKGCMLVKVAPLRKVCVLEYIKTKEKVNLVNSLKTFKGHLQVDGNVSYEVLDELPEIELMNCMVHARRKFEQCLDYNRNKAQQVLHLWQELYSVERSIKDESEEERYRIRQLQSVPILEKLKAWLDDNLNLDEPSNPLKSAIAYTLKRWDRLCKFVTVGYLKPDNNLIENQIRPLALGRKNYLFAGSHNGAKHAALFYSLFATCKLNNIDPFKWMTYVLKNIADHPINRIDELLPLEGFEFVNR